MLLQFSPATTGDELREVRRILASSPGRRPVRLLFDRASGNALRLDAGTEFSVNLTRDLEEKLSRWLVTKNRSSVWSGFQRAAECQDYSPRVSC